MRAPSVSPGPLPLAHFGEVTSRRSSCFRYSPSSLSISYPGQNVINANCMDKHCTAHRLHAMHYRMASGTYTSLPPCHMLLTASRHGVHKTSGNISGSYLDFSIKGPSIRRKKATREQVRIC